MRYPSKWQRMQEFLYWQHEFEVKCCILKKYEGKGLNGAVDRRFQPEYKRLELDLHYWHATLHCDQDHSHKTGPSSAYVKYANEGLVLLAGCCNVPTNTQHMQMKDIWTHAMNKIAKNTKSLLKFPQRWIKMSKPKILRHLNATDLYSYSTFS